MMNLEIRVPALGESVQEVQMSRLLKQAGDLVRADEGLALLESDKATVELPAPADGVLVSWKIREGDTVKVGESVAVFTPGAKAPAAAASADLSPVESPARGIAPSARRLISEHQIAPGAVEASGRGGRVVKSDVLRHIAQQNSPAVSAPVPAPPPSQESTAVGTDRDEQVVPMTRLRRIIAERLVQAQHQAALLTTFNEIDMSEVIQLRKEFQESFTKKHGTKLGFMSFFIKALVEALKETPALNAEIRGDNIVYKNYYDIGVAVGGGRGLVVPVLRHVDRMSFAEVEAAIADFGKRAGENRLEPSELQGGTFTVSNGGVYGSLLSTPIVNPPQSGVLGLHAIQERPIGKNGAIVLAPMMYVALTYDHRIVDGREAVTFLKRIKESVERPTRLLLDL